MLCEWAARTREEGEEHGSVTATGVKVRGSDGSVGSWQPRGSAEKVLGPTGSPKRPGKEVNYWA
jgi:hypothetical protein